MEDVEELSVRSHQCIVTLSPMYSSCHNTTVAGSEEGHMQCLRTPCKHLIRGKGTSLRSRLETHINRHTHHYPNQWKTDGVILNVDQNYISTPDMENIC
jgi:hypothetical protein